jgi:hypothetical protein
LWYRLHIFPTQYFLLEIERCANFRQAERRKRAIEHLQSRAAPPLRPCRLVEVD